MMDDAVGAALLRGHVQRRQHQRGPQVRGHRPPDHTPERNLDYFQDLPETLPYAKELVRREGRRFMFYGIDSNAYRGGNIAIGEITPATLAWLLNQQLSEATP